MPRGGILSLSATTPQVRPWSLTLGGIDATLGPAGGAAWGVPIDSIKVTEEGPTGVSALECTINDPTGALWPVDGMAVEYRDVAAGNWLFRGALDHWESRPAFGDQGRTIDLGATGIDGRLDATYVPPQVFAGGYYTAYWIATVAQLEAPELTAPSPWTGPAPGLGSLVGGASARNGNATYPIGALNSPLGNNLLISYGAITWPGGSLRACIDALLRGSAYQGSAGIVYTDPVAVLVAVDAQQRLRVWCDGPTDQPDDYTTLTVTDTAGGALRAEDLRFGGDPGGVLRQVYVSGASAAASGWFGDGSGIANGLEDGTADTALTTFEMAASRAAELIGANAGRVRGSFKLRDWSPTPATVHAGSLVTITDAASNATGTYRIYSIERTFRNSGRQDWLVSFGGRAPSLANLTRRLTRTLN